MLKRIGTFIIPASDDTSELLDIQDWKVLSLIIPDMDGAQLTFLGTNDPEVDPGDWKDVYDGENNQNQIAFTPDAIVAWSENANKLNVPYLAVQSDSTESAARSIEVWGVPRNPPC